MVVAYIARTSDFFNDLVDFLPPGIVLSLAAGRIEKGKYWDAYIKEFIGSMMMIAFTFSAGKWIGKETWQLAWAWHVCGVIAADYFGGGQQVNPAVTVSMWALAKVDYTEAFVRIAGQMGGGMVAFPLFHVVSETLNLEPFGGPEFSKESNAEAAISEFVAMFFLMWAIYILNWEFHFGKYHYWIKQFLTAVAIRALIELFPTAGPAMNPMLATAWGAFGTDGKFDFPDDNEHYFVYWLAPCLSAILASVTWGIYNGDRVFGTKIPVGPMKKKKTKMA